jgi:hypothetical protein
MSKKNKEPKNKEDIAMYLIFAAAIVSVAVAIPKIDRFPSGNVAGNGFAIPVKSFAQIGFNMD